MNLRRLLQLVVTSFLSQLLSILNQLLIPPFFLRFYGAGVEMYGEWIALSAAVSYLGTLNYGIQTYANNQMSILYNGGDLEGAKTVQASAFRLLLLLLSSFLLFGLVVFQMPIAGWLKLRHVSALAASWTLYLLIAQFAVQMLFSLLINSYQVVGRLHRGYYWSCLQRLIVILGIAVCVALRSSFVMLAAVQLITLLVCMLVVLVDVRVTAPVLLPSLRYGNWSKVRELIAPSGHFGLIAVMGFLTWQGPVLIIQRLLGPSAVAIFALVRVVFQMSRQIMMIASNIIAQDISILVGKRDWKELQRLYDLSERIVLFLVPTVTLSILVLCPFLFTVWLHQRNISDPLLCILMAAISAVMGLKEHKTQFQFSSNRHESLARWAALGQCVMLMLAVVGIKVWGLVAFLVLWLIWETMQTAWILQLNKALFPAEFKVSMQPVARLAWVMGVGLPLLIWPVYAERSWSLAAVVALGVSTALLFGVISYRLFDVDELRSMISAKLAARFGAAA